MLACCLPLHPFLFFNLLCLTCSFYHLLEPLRVTLSPKNLKTGISSTVILSCAVQGSPHYMVSWYRNTEPVLPDQHFSIQGAHNETLFISAAQKRHSGAYQCFATRKGQTAQDFSIILLEGMENYASNICKKLSMSTTQNCSHIEKEKIINNKQLFVDYYYAYTVTVVYTHINPLKSKQSLLTIPAQPQPYLILGNRNISF